MTIEVIICLAIIGSTFIALLRDYPVDAVMFFALLATVITGLLEPVEAFQGFATESVFTIALLFIVARSLSITGSLLPAFQRIMRPPKVLWVSKARLMSMVSLCSAFMNNTPIVSSLIPVVQQWCRQNAQNVSYFLMPLSYASIVGGLCSLIGTSTNLILNFMYIQAGGEGFELFEFAYAGIPIVIVCILYMLYASKFLHPHNAVQAVSNVREYSIELLVEPGSRIANSTIADANLRNLNGVALIEIIRDNEVLSNVGRSTELQGNDHLIFIGELAAVVDLESINGLILATNQVFKLKSKRGNHILIEAVISESYPFCERSVSYSDFRRYYGAAIIAISREGRRIKKQIGDIVLKPGDVLVLEADLSFIKRHKNSRDFLVLSEVEQGAPINREKRGLTLGIVAMALILATFHIVSLLVSMGLAVVALVLFKCINLRNLRTAVDQKIIITIGSAIALGAAFSKSGADQLLTSYLLDLGVDGIYSALILLFTVTSIITAMITNVAAVVLMFPIAQQFSQSLGLPVEPFLITIAFASSASFATPIGYQTNLMVAGPGGYKFRDFLKIGLPLTVIVGVLTVILAPLIWL